MDLFKELETIVGEIDIKRGVPVFLISLLAVYWVVALKLLGIEVPFLNS